MNKDVFEKREWRKNKEVKCLDCGFLHKTTRHIYFHDFSVGESGICSRDGLRCNKCGNEILFEITDKRAKRILNKWLTKSVKMTEQEKIIRAMEEYANLRKAE